MTEEHIRAVFDHIEATRDRWEKLCDELKTHEDFSGGWFAVESDHYKPAGIVCYEPPGYGGDSSRGTIPWLAFSDFDAAANAKRVYVMGERLRQETAVRERREREERAQLARLLAKYGPLAD